MTHDPDKKLSNFARSLFGLNTKTLENCRKRMSPLLFLSPADAPERKEMGPRHGGSGGGARSR